MASSRAIEAAKAFVRIYADDSALRRTLQSAVGAMQSFGIKIAKIGAGMTGLAAAGLAPLTAAVFKFAESGAAIDDVVQRTGASSESLSQLKYAAEQSGTSIETVEKGMRKLSQTVTSAADGSQSAADALGAIGLSAKDLQGLSPDQQFLAVAQGLSQIEDPGEKAARAMDILGKSGAEMVPLMADGADGIKALMEQADQLGLTITGDQAKAAAEFDDLWHSVTTTAMAAAVQIGAALAPTISELMKRVVPLIGSLVNFIKQNSGIIVAIAGTVVAIGAAGMALTTLGGIITATATVLGAILSPMGLFIAAAVGIGVSIVQAMGGASAAMQYLQDAFPGLSSAAGETFKAIKDALNAGEYQLAAQILWASLKVAWLTGIDALSREWLIWKKAFQDTFAAAVDTVMGMWRGLQNKLSAGFVHIMAFFDSSINADQVMETLNEDIARKTAEIERQSKQDQAERDRQFESNIGQANNELEQARSAWREAVNKAATIAEDRANDPNAAAVADDRFTELLNQLRAGDIATRVDAAAKGQSGVQDVRSVAGQSQLMPFINRAGTIDKQQLDRLTQISNGIGALVTVTRRGPQVVNV
jgi:hypothetical protein